GPSQPRHPNATDQPNRPMYGQNPHPLRYAIARQTARALVLTENRLKPIAADRAELNAPQRLVYRPEKQIANRPQSPHTENPEHPIRSTIVDLHKQPIVVSPKDFARAKNYPPWPPWLGAVKKAAIMY